MGVIGIVHQLIAMASDRSFDSASDRKIWVVRGVADLSEHGEAAADR